MSEPDYVVIHDPAAPSLHGVWYDRSEMVPSPFAPEPPPNIGVAAYVPTGLFQTRDDGAVAQVWRVAEGSCDHSLQAEVTEACHGFHAYVCWRCGRVETEPRST